MPELLKQFGILETIFDPDTLISHNGMVVDAQQLVAFWRRCSLSSDFWSRYTGCFVAPNALKGYLNRESAEGVYSYVLNELFENSAKFSKGSDLDVRYDCWVLADPRAADSCPMCQQFRKPVYPGMKQATGGASSHRPAHLR